MQQILKVLIVASLFNFGCGAPPQTNDPIPLYETFTITSKEVGEERTINIWTPDNYKSDADSLAVLYMLDGGIKEDFPHIANTLSALISQNTIKPLILVGIENTERRRDLTGFTEVQKDKEIAKVVGGSTQFRSFVNNELFAEINKRYRTTAEKGIIGESLAGLFVLETLLTQPEMFDHYIAFDPSIWWNDHILVKNSGDMLKKVDTSSKSLWFAGSGADDINKYTNELANILKTNAPENVKWHYADEPNEKHATIFRATKEKALTWVFGIDNPK